MSDDIHSPTTAGPTPEPAATAAPAAGPAPAPSTMASLERGPQPPPASVEEHPELPFGIPPDRPEILVGAAFAGGVLAAIILKRLGGD